MELWQHVCTQWRATGFGLLGLDYPAVRTEARHLGIHISYSLMRKLQALERFELNRKRGGNSDEPGSQGNDKRR